MGYSENSAMSEMAPNVFANSAMSEMAPEVFGKSAMSKIGARIAQPPTYLYTINNVVERSAFLYIILQAFDSKLFKKGEYINRAYRTNISIYWYYANLCILVLILQMASTKKGGITESAPSDTDSEEDEILTGTASKDIKALLGGGSVTVPPSSATGSSDSANSNSNGQSSVSGALAVKSDSDSGASNGGGEARDSTAQSLSGPMRNLALAAAVNSILSKAPRVFDNIKEKDFRAWSQRFVLHLQCSTLPEEAYTLALLNNLGSEPMQTATYLQISATTPFKDAMKRLMRHYSPRETLEELRSRFQYRRQEPNESIEDFARDLRIFSARAFPGFIQMF